MRCGRGGAGEGVGRGNGHSCSQCGGEVGFEGVTRRCSISFRFCFSDKRDIRDGGGCRGEGTRHVQAIGLQPGGDCFRLWTLRALRRAYRCGTTLRTHVLRAHASHWTKYASHVSSLRPDWRAHRTPASGACHHKSTSEA